jgi:hypothetical protein
MRVAGWLFEQGFAPATADGLPTTIHSDWQSVGVLIGAERAYTKRFGFLKLWSRRPFLGVLRFGSDFCILSYFGRDQEAEVKRLAKALADQFGLRVSATLSTEYSRSERFL